MTKNWGFCLASEPCRRYTDTQYYVHQIITLNFVLLSLSNRPRRRRNLQHIYLDILTPTQCKIFAKRINNRRELCGGQKILPNMKVYEDRDGEFKELSTKDIDERKIVPSVLTNRTSLGFNFTIGGGDTCQASRYS